MVGEISDTDKTVYAYAHQSHHLNIRIFSFAGPCISSVNAMAILRRYESFKLHGSAPTQWLCFFRLLFLLLALLPIFFSIGISLISDIYFTVLDIFISPVCNRFSISWSKTSVFGAKKTGSGYDVDVCFNRLILCSTNRIEIQISDSDGNDVYIFTYISEFCCVCVCVCAHVHAAFKLNEIHNNI